MDKVNLKDKLEMIAVPWDPKVIADLNGQQVKLALFEGAFVWHHHEREDELFLVLEGELEMEFRDHTEKLGPGELIVVPRGVEHRPVSMGGARVLLFEPASTLNTGNVRDGRTIDRPGRI